MTTVSHEARAEQQRDPRRQIRLHPTHKPRPWRVSAACGQRTLSRNVRSRFRGGDLTSLASLVGGSPEKPLRLNSDLRNASRNAWETVVP